MIIKRALIAKDWPDQFRQMFPGILLVDLEDFAELMNSDRLLDDDLQPTEHCLIWAARVAARLKPGWQPKPPAGEADGAGATPQPPRPPVTPAAVVAKVRELLG